MPIEKKVISCDCGNGELIELAETRRGKTSSTCGAPIKSTIFYGCTKCPAIYTQNRSKSFPDKEPEFGSFKPYTGKLTRTQIISRVPEVTADFTDYEEQRILKV